MFSVHFVAVNLWLALAGVPFQGVNQYAASLGINLTTGNPTGGVLNLVSRQVALILARAGVMVA
jgi:hypothetical protein